MIRVAKVGGSLLTWPQLPRELNAWLSNVPQATTVLIAGGGPWTELLRQSAKRFDLTEASAHAMCLQVMSVTASLLADVCTRSCTRSLPELRAAMQTDQRIVFDVQEWLLGDDASDLPKTWEVTSDSIAARLAMELKADKLVLFKSSPAPLGNLRELANADYVDRYFPTAAAKVPTIQYACLRTS